MVGTTAPRVKQLAKKLAEAETRFAELVEEEAIARFLVERETAVAFQVRIDEIRATAHKQRAEEPLWDQVVKRSRCSLPPSASIKDELLVASKREPSCETSSEPIRRQ